MTAARRIAYPTGLLSLIAAPAAQAASTALTFHPRKKQSQLLLPRDIFGNPFRAVAVDPLWLQWNGATVPNLARSIYEGRRFGELPVLADALEEAGCTDADLLTHCRRPGDHVRGCWAVDALLGQREIWNKG
jgi:hypothetical protein